MRALRTAAGVGLILFGVALLLYGVWTPGDASAQTYTRTVSDTVPLSATGTVNIDNHEGSIRVRTWDRNEVKYDVEFVSEVSEEAVQNATLDVQTRSDEVSLVPNAANVDGKWTVNLRGIRRLDGMPDVHFTLTIPEGAHLDVTDHESEIDVEGLAGDLRLDTHEGRIDIRTHRGTVDIGAHESPIRLDDIRGNVTLDLHDADVEAEVINGTVDLEAHEGDADLHFSALVGPLRVETHEADITLRLPRDTGFDLFTVFGDDDADLDADFDLGPLRIQTGTDEDEIDYRGSVNGGGPQIEIRGHEPDVRLYTR
jgi:hypothetical protein